VRLDGGKIGGFAHQVVRAIENGLLVLGPRPSSGRSRRAFRPIALRECPQAHTTPRDRAWMIRMPGATPSRQLRFRHGGWPACTAQSRRGQRASRQRAEMFGTGGVSLFDACRPRCPETAARGPVICQLVGISNGNRSRRVEHRWPEFDEDRGPAPAASRSRSPRLAARSRSNQHRAKKERKPASGRYRGFAWTNSSSPCSAENPHVESNQGGRDTQPSRASQKIDARARRSTSSRVCLRPGGIAHLTARGRDRDARARGYWRAWGTVVAAAFRVQPTRQRANRPRMGGPVSHNQRQVLFDIRQQPKRQIIEISGQSASPSIRQRLAAAMLTAAGPESASRRTGPPLIWHRKPDGEPFQP